MADGSFSELSKNVFQCIQCEENFKTEKGLKIHIGRMHKENVIESTPEKDFSQPYSYQAGVKRNSET